MGRYIVDFVCFDRRLVIEVDGGQHTESKADAARDAWLQDRGFTVMRFSNQDVLRNSVGVQYAIADALGLGWLP
jgi:very-short-patch-repair endonuclease